MQFATDNPIFVQHRDMTQRFLEIDAVAVESDSPSVQSRVAAFQPPRLGPDATHSSMAYVIAQSSTIFATNINARGCTGETSSDQRPH
eukprot:10335848-Karenia_brevis.AAC.1